MRTGARAASNSGLGSSMRAVLSVSEFSVQSIAYEQESKNMRLLHFGSPLALTGAHYSSPLTVVGQSSTLVATQSGAHFVGAREINNNSSNRRLAKFV